MKKIFLVGLISSIASVSFANYTMKYPIEVNNGGSLPNGAIKFKENIPVVIDPVYPEILDCTSYSLSAECDERLGEWQAFATSKSLSNNWNNLYWWNSSLTSIPSKPYPIKSVNILILRNNQLVNLDGLINITNATTYLYAENNLLNNVNGLGNLSNVGDLWLHNNQLQNINGLNSLTNVTNYLQLQNNQLTNVNGLSNLTNVGSIYLENNNISNISGLINLRVNGYIKIDNTYSGNKLAANTPFCLNNPTARFPAGFATKTQLCE